MTTTFVDTAGPGDAEAPPKRLRTAEAIIPMNGLFAAQDIKAGTIVAHYQLMVVPTEEQAKSIWKKTQEGKYDSLLSQIKKRRLSISKKKWDKTLKTLEKLKPLFDKYNDYKISHGQYEFCPDLSFGIEVKGRLWSRAIERTPELSYPGLSGMFANEPGPLQTENVEPQYYETMTAGRGHDSDNSFELLDEIFQGACTPRLLLKASRDIRQNSEIVWCYGGTFTDRGYKPNCGELPAVDVSNPNYPISEWMLGAIVICCLLDVSGAVRTIEKTEVIPGPGEMAELYKRSRKDNDLTMVHEAKRPGDRLEQIQRMVDEYIENSTNSRASAYMKAVQGLLFQIDSKLQSE